LNGYCSQATEEKLAAARAYRWLASAKACPATWRAVSAGRVIVLFADRSEATGIDELLERAARDGDVIASVMAAVADEAGERHLAVDYSGTASDLIGIGRLRLRWAVMSNNRTKRCSLRDRWVVEVCQLISRETDRSSIA
jgi:hypothetical protein